MLGFIQKLLPCFSSPQQSDGVFVREGFTTVPEIKPHTTSVPPPQHSSSAPPSSSNILPPSRRDSPITRDRNVVTETTTTQIVNTVPPNVVEDSEEGDEHWEDWRDPDATTPTSNGPQIPTSMAPTGLPKTPSCDANSLPLSIDPISTLSLSRKPSSSEPKEKEKEKEAEEKPAEPEVDWFSDMTPTYKPPPRLVTPKLPTITPVATIRSNNNSSSSSSSVPSNRLSLASLEMEQEEIDDDGWIEEESELTETAAPTKMSRLDAQKQKKEQRKAKKGKKATPTHAEEE